MQTFEYKVVPAPAKGTKAKGVKTPQDRFANSVEILLNEMAAEGWDYQRAELLPSEERSGLTGSATNWRNVLIFRRALPQEAEAESIKQADTPAGPPLPEFRHTPAQAPAAPAPRAEPALTATAGDPEAPEGATPVPGAGARKMIADDGVEELSPVSGLTAALKARAGLKGRDNDPDKG